MLEKKWDRAIWNIKYVVGMATLTKVLLLVKAYLVGRYFLLEPRLLDYELVFGEIGILAFLVSDGLMAAVIWYSCLVEELEGQERMFAYLNNVVNLVLVSLVPLLGLFLGLMGLGLIRISREMQYFILIGSPIVILTTVKVIYTGYLQKIHGFFAGNRGNVARAIIYILVLLTFKGRIGLYGLMGLGLITSLVQVYIGYTSTKKKGYSYACFLEDTGYLRGTVKRGLAISLVVTAYEYSLFWRQENILTIFLMGIVLSAVTTVIFPILSEDYIRYRLGKEDLSAFNYDFSRALGVYLKILLPFMIVIFFQSKNLRILLKIQEGAQINLLFYSGMGVVAISILPFVLRSLVAIEEYVKLFIVMGLSSLVGLGILRVHGDGRLAFDIALFISTLLGLKFIDRKTGYSRSREFRTMLEGLVRPGLAIFFLNMAIYYIYLVLDIDFMNQELFHIGLALVATVLLGGIFHRHKKNN